MSITKLRLIRLLCIVAITAQRHEIKRKFLAGWIECLNTRSALDQHTSNNFTWSDARTSRLISRRETAVNATLLYFPPSWSFSMNWKLKVRQISSTNFPFWHQACCHEHNTSYWRGIMVLANTCTATGWTRTSVYDSMKGSVPYTFVMVDRTGQCL